MASPPTRARQLAFRTLQGAAWLGSSQLVGQLVQVALRLVVARLLVPSDFGRAAMVLVVIGVAEFFTDIGTVQALVQRPQLPPRALHTAFWIHAALGGLAFVLTFSLAPLMAGFFREPTLTGMLRAGSAVLLLSSLAAPAAALLLREMRFSSLAWRQMLGTALGGTVAVVLAALGFGAWALVWERLVTTAFSTAFLFRAARYIPRAGFDRQLAREIWRFGAPLRAALLVNMVAKQADRVLIGRLLGAADLGIYNLASQGLIRPLQMLSRPAAQALFPALATLTPDPPRFAAAARRSVEAAAASLSLPVVVGVIWAPVLVPWVLGTQWVPAVQPLQVLALGSVPLLPASFLAAVMVAWGNTTAIFWLSLASAILLPAGVLAGAPWGITGVAGGVALAFWLGALVQAWYFGRPIAGDAGFFLRPHLKAVALALLTLPGALLWPVSYPHGFGRGPAVTAGLVFSWWLLFHGELRSAWELLRPRLSLTRSSEKTVDGPKPQETGGNTHG